MVGMNLRFSPLSYSSSRKTFDFGGSAIIGANAVLPFMGEERYLVTARNKSNLYYKRLVENHGIIDEDIYTSVIAAHAAMTADQNDVLYVTPGAHVVTEEVAWSKNFCHMVGLAGPTSFNDYSEPGCSIYTTTAGVAETVDLTGNYCQFRGINFTNNGANTGNLAAFNVDGYSAQFDGCSFHGAMNTTSGVAAAAALYIDGLGSWYQFHNCVIGDDNWFARDSANSGQLAYVSPDNFPEPQHGIFKDCRFRLRSETAAVAMVRFPSTNVSDRIHEFVDCSFTNFSTNFGNTLNQVFYDNGAIQTTYVLVRNCTASGFTEWQTGDHGLMFQGSNALANKGGGLAVELTT